MNQKIMNEVAEIKQKSIIKIINYQNWNPGDSYRQIKEDGFLLYTSCCLFGRYSPMAICDSCGNTSVNKSYMSRYEAKHSVIHTPGCSNVF